LTFGSVTRSFGVLVLLGKGDYIYVEPFVPYALLSQGQAGDKSVDLVVRMLNGLNASVHSARLFTCSLASLCSLARGRLLNEWFERFSRFERSWCG
jgi:hypothetical protein